VSCAASTGLDCIVLYCTNLFSLSSLSPSPLYCTVQYDLFVINLVLQLLKTDYPQYNGGGGGSEYRLHALQGGVACAALVGSIFGQLIAGSCADIVGR
jgi:MFS family permease